jgi:CRP/FNR family cyclic AMP-dependent transcriptional regulator
VSNGEGTHPARRAEPVRPKRSVASTIGSRIGREEIMAALARCRWFRQLSRDELQDVLREGTLLALPKGKAVFETGDVSDEVYVLITGRIAISTTGVNGREIGFRHYAPGDCFGELAALDGKVRSANAKALQTTHLFRIPGAGFRRLLAAYPCMAEEVLKSLARLVRALSDRIAENGARAPVRIIAGLVQLAEDAAATADATRVPIHPVPTDEELAAHYDSHRESVNRVVNELKRRGLISRSRSSLVVLDLPALRRHLDDLRG